MFRRILLVALALAPLLAAQDRGSKLGRIDVDNYAIDAEINPRTQTLTANVKVRFVALDSDISSASFELNNAFNVSRVVDDSGHQIPASRSGQDMGVRAQLSRAAGERQGHHGDVHLRRPLDRPGRIAGLRHQVRRHPERHRVPDVPGALVSGERLQRGSIHCRSAYHRSGRIPGDCERPGKFDSPRAPARLPSAFNTPSPRSLEASPWCEGDPVKVNSEGVTTSVYFRQKQNMANAYGEETGKVLSFLTSVYGLAPQANLTLVETEDGTPNGYSAPGIIFLSPRAIGNQVAVRLLANQLARQWWETLVSPINRDHLWLENGNARYAELLWEEHANGPAALEQDLHDTYVEALTVDNPPLIQAGRLDDYSPEYWALTAGKGAAMLNMLRSVMGNDNFNKLMSSFTEKYSWQSVSTVDFRKLAEQIYGSEPAVLLRAVAGVERRARVQDGIYGVSHAEGLPRDGQDLAGPGHVSDAGGSEDRNRRQPGNQAHRRSGHLVRVHGGYVWQTEDGDHRSDRARCCAGVPRCAWRWPSSAASSSPRLANSATR